jgi:hypothetical protein
VKNNPLVNHIYKVNALMSDPMETGFITWTYKQQLLEASWVLEDVLKKSPTYVGEAEWISEQQTQRAFDQISKSA